MSNEHTISVKISEAEVNDMLSAVDISGTIDDLKDTVDNLEYELSEVKDTIEYDISDLKGDYNDLDDRLSELQNDNSAETFAERLEALEKYVEGREKNNCFRVHE